MKLMQLAEGPPKSPRSASLAVSRGPGPWVATAASQSARARVSSIPSAARRRAGNAGPIIRKTTPKTALHDLFISLTSSSGESAVHRRRLDEAPVKTASGAGSRHAVVDQHHLAVGLV